MDFGGVDNTGVATCTAGLQAAIDWVSKNSNTKNILYFPNGTYKTGQLILKSNITIYFQDGVLIKGTENYLDYPVVHTLGNMDGAYRAFFETVPGAANIVIKGRGVIDPRGWKMWGSESAPSSTVKTFDFYKASHVVEQDIVIKNTDSWHHYVALSDNVSLTNVKCISPGHHWTDGFDFGCSRNCTVGDSLVYNKDDCTSNGSDQIDKEGRTQYNLTFNNNVLYTNFGTGLRISPCIDSDIYNVYCTNNYVVRCTHGVSSDTYQGYNSFGHAYNWYFTGNYFEITESDDIAFNLTQSTDGSRYNIFFDGDFFNSFGSKNSLITGYNPTASFDNCGFNNLWIANNNRNSALDAHITTNAFATNINFTQTSLGAATVSSVTKVSGIQDISAAGAADWFIANVDEKEMASSASISLLGTLNVSDIAGSPQFSYKDGAVNAGSQTSASGYTYGDFWQSIFLLKRGVE